ncbi:Relaxase/Mobilisation nuclease domain-containing protein [Ruminococcaceae bacterium P7]|nr:Relaxase/Mobilisation nuclease domain-containing protein [Ruminococcaceae bacterium P7]
MAIVKTISPKIKTQAHLCEALAYITQEKKASSVYYHRCRNYDGIEQVARDFESTRIACNQNKGIIAAHIVQSFSPEDNISPEAAHKIGIQTINNCFADFQVVMATHTDREHLHNHFIINSVSVLDNKKFLDNMKVLNQIRKVSDELCYKNDLSVIESDNVTKYAPLDQATLNAAKRGHSWKLRLVKDLDKALEDCQSKNEFINYFQTHGYEIKFTNKNITFRKNGEKKGIRADTLAKQFGQKYSKASIEKRLNISNSENINPKAHNSESSGRRFQIPSYDYYNQLAAINWKRYEKKYADKIRVTDKRLGSPNLFTKNPFLFSLRLIRFILNQKNKNRYNQKRRIKSYSTTYQARSFVDYKRGKKVLENIPYKDIVNSFGESVQIKLYAWQITHLLNNNILLSSRIDLKTGTAVVTLKKTDLQRVSAILGVSYNSFAEQAEKIKNRKITAELKKNNLKLSHLLVTPKQAEALREHCITFASYKKGDKLNIAFAPEDKEKVLNTLYPNREEKKVNKETFFKRNAVINRKLKQISQETGEKLCYKIVLSNQYKLLRNTTLEFAVFRTDNGKYNVVFLESQKSAIEKTLGTFKPKAPNANINPNLKL